MTVAAAETVAGPRSGLGVIVHSPRHDRIEADRSDASAVLFLSVRCA